MRLFGIRLTLILLAIPSLVLLVIEGILAPAPKTRWSWIKGEFTEWKQFYCFNWNRD